MRSRTPIAIAATVAAAFGVLMLLPTYADLRWLGVTIGAVIVVGLVAEGSRMLGVPTLLSPVLALLGLAFYVTAVYAHSEAALGFLPDGAARSALRQLTDQGWHDVSVLRAPVPSSQGLVLLTVCGVGLVAIAIDLLAVVVRRPALAGLPLLALFSVSASTVPHGVGWLPFVYGGVGYLVLLLTESADRVGRWGRPLGNAVAHGSAPPPTHAERPQTGPLIQVGRRVGVAALGLAVIVPAAVPGLHPGIFGTGGGHGNGFGGHGNSTVTTFNPILKIQRQLTHNTSTTLLVYQSSDADPGYLRMTALDQFDGTGWTQALLSAKAGSRIDRFAPAPDGLGADVATSEVRTTVSATNDLEVPWLPVPYPAVSVSVDKGDWRWDNPSRAIFSTQTTTRGRDWDVISRGLHPTVTQLEKSGIDYPLSVLPARDLELRTVPAVLINTASDVTHGAKTPFDKALALQNYFHSSHFHYTLDAPSNDSRTVIADFLGDGQGYCVQFAATMALMARAVGIPARVAIGFTHGTQDTDGRYAVTSLDAHAWPELYFPGFGWLPFEPTPRGDGQAEAPAYTRPGGTTPAPGSSQSGIQPTPAPTGSPQPSSPPGQLRQFGEQPIASLANKHHHSHWGGVLGGLVVLALLACVPGTARQLTRRRRWTVAETGAAQAHTAWRELADDVRDLGLHWRDGDSPRRAGARLISATGLHTSAAALGRLSDAEERARYARTLDDVGDLAADERAIRHELAELVGRRRRWAATVMPRSTLRATFSAIGNRIADLLDLVDAGFAYVFRLVTPGRLRRT